MARIELKSKTNIPVEALAVTCYDLLEGALREKGFAPLGVPLHAVIAEMRRGMAMRSTTQVDRSEMAHKDPGSILDPAKPKPTWKIDAINYEPIRKIFDRLFSVLGKQLMNETFGFFKTQPTHQLMACLQHVKDMHPRDAFFAMAAGVALASGSNDPLLEQTLESLGGTQ